MRKVLIFLTVMGPGLISALAGNDAGGIATYTVLGARFDYRLLWLLGFLTFSLVMVQEMAARMGTVTGKGLSDLIREQFGVRWTLVAMLALLSGAMATAVAEFAGIAASVGILTEHLPYPLNWLAVPWVNVPLAALVTWGLITRGSYRGVERIFLVLTSAFLAYVAAALLARPHWGQVFHTMLVPSREWFSLDPEWFALAIATAGTTVAPWMQFYLQSSMVEKGVNPTQYPLARLDVVAGALAANAIAFFIIVAAATQLQGMPIETAADAARALGPVAGAQAKYLFALGLFGASMLGASVLPLSTAYAVSEAFGWPSGVNERFADAPRFFGLFTLIIGAGAGLVLMPGVNLMAVMVASQVINGMLLPVTLVFMLRLVNNRRLMGKHTNGPLYNLVVWATVVLLSVLVALMLGRLVI